jgi:hypothetical protein
MDKAEYVFEKYAVMKVPNWAKPFAKNKNKILHITKQPKDYNLKIKLRMLQGGRLDSYLYKNKAALNNPKGGLFKDIVKPKWRESIWRKPLKK